MEGGAVRGDGQLGPPVGCTKDGCGSGYRASCSTQACMYEEHISDHSRSGVPSGKKGSLLVSRWGGGRGGVSPGAQEEMRSHQTPLP